MNSSSSSDNNPVHVALVRERPYIDVLGSVAVDDVHDDQQAHAVRSVHQELQVLWRPRARGDGEEICDVVAEAAIVRVLHDGHELTWGKCTKQGAAANK